MDLAHRSAGRRGHPPEAARAHDAPAVADQDQLRAVGRPRGRDVVVPRAVVIARQVALPVLGETHGRAALRRHHEHVPPPLVLRGDERDAGAVRRPPRLEVHRAVARQRGARPVRGIQQAQLHGIVVVARVHDVPAVGRPVRLMVVSRARRELLRLVAIHALPPERPPHGIDDLGAVGGPGDGARPARHLRHVHLAPVIGMRDEDLLERQLAPRGAALGRAGRGDEEGDRRDDRREGPAHGADITPGSEAASTPRRRDPPGIDDDVLDAPALPGVRDVHAAVARLDHRRV